MSRIILWRHGQSLNNAGETDHFDSYLSKRGEYQVADGSLHIKEVIEWLPDEPSPFICFVSPYMRTLRTAHPLRHLGIKIIVEPRIGELPDDHQKKLKFDKIPHRGTIFDYDWRDFPKEGLSVFEWTLEQYQLGLEQFLKELPEDAIIVSHMSPIIKMASILTGRDLTGKEVSNCSLTLIEDGQLIFIGKR